MSLPNFKLNIPIPQILFSQCCVQVDVVLRLSSLSFLDAVSKTCIKRYGTILKTLDFDSIFITHSFCSFLILSTSASTLWFTQLKKHLITASYVDDETSMLHEMAKNAWITVLGETTSHNSVNLTWPLVWISTLLIVCVRGKIWLTLSRLSWSHVLAL